MSNKFWYEYLKADRLGEGESINISSKEYIMRNNILREKSIYSDNQAQTKDTFGFKWSKRETYESAPVQESHRKWLVERYLQNNKDLLRDWLPNGAKILDAGCGSGYSSFIFFESYFNNVNYLGADISTAVDVAIKRFNERGFQAEFIQADLLNLPFSEPIFDMIFSEGVLHHTDSTEKAIKYLSTLLLPGGRFLFYVYCKKSPIREFVDDYIREHIKDMNDQEAWDALIPLTKLGKVLGDLNLTVDVPEAIPYLGIPAGNINIQRLFYWHIFKAYYKPDWTIDEMNHINFDWYRPLNCYRHTPEEISKWCSEAGLKIENLNVQESGITVVARR